MLNKLKCDLNALEYDIVCTLRSDFYRFYYYCYYSQYVIFIEFLNLLE